MSEIKSAIELAMERTKNLVMNDKEKREASIRESEQRITALVRRFMGAMIDERHFMEEYTQIPGDGPLKRSLVMDVVAQEIEACGGDGKLFGIVRMTCGDSLKDEIGALEKRFNEEIEGQRVRVRTKIEKRLEEMGVRGSAVEPNISGWDEWKEALDQGKNIFKRQVAEWKERFGAAKS